MSPPRESRLARWSRLKAEAKAAQRPAAHAPPPANAPDKPVEQAPATGVPQPPPAAAPGEGAHDPDAIAALPDIETLDADSDYTGFLAEGVPEKLAKAALRKLWLSDPVLANVDGLNDYDEDFNLIDTLIDASQTGYQVGRGHVVEDEPGEAEAEQLAEQSDGAGDQAALDEPPRPAAADGDSTSEEARRSTHDVVDSATEPVSAKEASLAGGTDSDQGDAAPGHTQEDGPHDHRGADRSVTPAEPS